MEPIAIIGIGCRFPGAKDPQAFWRLLRDGGEAISEVPADRWDAAAFYDPDPAAPGKINTRFGGFLDQIDQFDAAFFRLSSREAVQMDPQQRLLLEVAWEALEDAGQVPEHLLDSQTGIFVGIMSNDYGWISRSDFYLVDAYSGSGNCFSIAANRLSYVFGFRGPSMAINTACSSSLVAVHLACASLHHGECSLALAGGVNVLLSPWNSIHFTKAGLMAPDGRCKAFDARANGIVRGEGAGIVVLKPLSGALADRDPIYAVIRGSAINHDGRTNGLAAPSRWAQEAILRRAYQQAGVSPGQVQYVEAHGTGTSLGDAIEAKALGTVLAVDRPPGSRCLVGSVKSNIGNLETAAGVASLIKVVLSLKHKVIPPSLHFQEPNPHIPFDKLPLRVQRTLSPWPKKSGRALAGVSTFGFGGANAHAVLEEAPSLSQVHVHDKELFTNRPHLLPLSARSREALHALAQSYHQFLAGEGTTMSLFDICYTASVRRSHHEHRLALMGQSREELIECLEAFLHKETCPDTVPLWTCRTLSWSTPVLGGQDQGRTRAGQGPKGTVQCLSYGHCVPGRQQKVAFVFSGQGSQWFGMGRGLMEQEPVFWTALEQCDEVLRRYASWSLLAELTADELQSRLDDTEIAQPVIFALQVALTAQWRSWGIEPDAVIGHGLGEVAAAHIAGILSLKDAVRLVFLRGRLIQRANGQAKMSVQVLQGLDPKPASATAVAALPFFSTAVGRISDGRDLDATHWRRNIKEPVHLAAEIAGLAREGYSAFLEISPHPVLPESILRCLDQQEAIILASLRHDQGERAQMLASLGVLYTLGHPVDWSKLYPSGGCCVSLPSYPWQRERFWLEGRERITGFRWEGARPAQNRAQRHPLLGSHWGLASGTHVWEGELDRQFLDYLDDHRIYGTVVLPVSAYIEMAMAATAEACGPKSYILAEVEFHRALFLSKAPPPITQVILSPCAEGKASFRVYSRPTNVGQSDETWTLHVTGQAHYGRGGAAPPVLKQSDLKGIQVRCPEEVSGQDFYARLNARGNQWGPCFQGIKRIWRGDREALGEVQVPQALESTIGTYQFHPAVFDACGQVLSAIVAFEKPDQEGVFVGAGINQVRLYGQPCGLRLWSHARVRHSVKQKTNVLEGDVRVMSESGRIVLESIGVRLYYLDRHARKEGKSPNLTREALLAAEPALGHRLLESYLCEQVAKVLGSAVSRLDVQQPVNTLGLDSLMALKLKNQIQCDLGVVVPLVDFFKGCTIAQLTQQLLHQVTTLASTSSKPLALTIAPSRAKELLAQLDQLSDENVDSLLNDLVAAKEGGE